jgi:hypothetical protein
MTTQKTTFETLASIDCSKYVEKKNGLTYLSWAWAWGIVKGNFPDANYKVVSFDGKPYLHDEHLGYLVATEVTIQGETIGMQLPVMDGANRAQKHVMYQKFGKDVQPATMFDINTAIMRCLTKNLAMFGLGHYIYAGEDLPKVVTKQLSDDEIILAVGEANSIKDLTDLWNANKPISAAVSKVFETKKKQFVVVK